MLLDELMAERDRAPEPEPAPEPQLSVDPVAVPLAGEVGRREARQRLVELEEVARRNLRSAEEARRVLHEEHARLNEEASARTKAQHEAQALRRELERLRDDESRRADAERTRAERAARAQIADELKRFHEEHERVVHELDSLRGTLSDHDSLLDEYASRLREEQQARAALRAEVDRAEAARELAERSLEAVTENLRRRAEDETIRLATTEQELADARSDRDRLASQLAELTGGEGQVGRLAKDVEARDAEIARLQVTIADLSARLDATEEAAQTAIGERDAAVARQVAEAEERARDAERNQGRLRREASEAAKALRAAQEARAVAEAERDDLRARVAEVEAELGRSRADGDRLRAHASALGDELAAVRATVAELQAAAPAPTNLPEMPVAAAAAEWAPPESVPEPELEATSERPPLPLRIAGRHAPAPEPVRVRRHEEVEAPAATSARPEAIVAPEPIAEPVATPEPAAVPAASVASAQLVAIDEPAGPDAAQGARLTAMAELTSLAAFATDDDFTFRRR